MPQRRIAMKCFSSAGLIILATAMLAANAARGAEPAQASDPSAIEYTSFEQAINALHAKPGVKFHDEDSWVVAEDLQALTVWLLTLPGNPAYPSIMKRAMFKSADAADVETHVRCFASKEVCDKYFSG
jgi:hypothetical protein